MTCKILKPSKSFETFMKKINIVMLADHLTVNELKETLPCEGK